MTSSVAARRVCSVLLVLAALAWIPLNKPVEGPILLALTDRHGITAADLLSVAAVLLALVVWPWGAGTEHRAGRRR